MRHATASEWVSELVRRMALLLYAEQASNENAANAMKRKRTTTIALKKGEAGSCSSQKQKFEELGKFWSFFLSFFLSFFASISYACTQHHRHRLHSTYAYAAVDHRDNANATLCI